MAECLAHSCGFQISAVETDAAQVIQSIKRGFSLAEEGVLIEDILFLLSDVFGWSCCHVCRTGNSVAHASYAFHSVLEIAQFEAIPHLVSHSPFMLVDLA